MHLDQTVIIYLVFLRLTALLFSHGSSISYIKHSVCKSLYTLTNHHRSSTSMATTTEDQAFRLAVLILCKMRPYTDRMPHRPCQALDAKEFLSKNWRMFIHWTSLTRNEQTQCLRNFMLSKFSLDPYKRVMNPGPGHRRKRVNNARWIGIDLTDDEMDRVVDEVMRGYTETTEIIEIIEI